MNILIDHLSETNLVRLRYENKPGFGVLLKRSEAIQLSAALLDAANWTKETITVSITDYESETEARNRNSISNNLKGDET